MVIRKLFKAECAHRVLGAYTQKCRGIHGHSYRFEVFLKGESLDCTEMVMDFKLLKEKLYSFMDAFDHSLIVYDKDEYLVSIAQNLNERYMIVPYNPTAEQFAVHIYMQAKALGLDIAKVIVHETDTGCAIYEGGDFSIELDRVVFSEALDLKPNA
ncbi:MAG: 6-pyruvoyl trahydropterin synthase family protein [Campylobacterales bacterium]